MKCPKCEEGILNKIKFKNSNRHASLCEFCGTIWSEKEYINQFGGHAFESQLNKDKQEYSFDDRELDQESEDIYFTKFK